MPLELIIGLLNHFFEVQQFIWKVIIYSPPFILHSASMPPSIRRGYVIALLSLLPLFVSIKVRQQFLFIFLVKFTSFFTNSLLMTLNVLSLLLSVDAPLQIVVTPPSNLLSYVLSLKFSFGSLMIQKQCFLKYCLSDSSRFEVEASNLNFYVNFNK